ncbi:MAG: DUF1552 domain-containing protein [Alphaproteobacteria bacterium]|nr:DUF1552 domain-containing protein [Alphaproteobacteria bacterium]
MTVLLPRQTPRRAALRGLLGGGAVTLALPFLDAHLNNNGTALAATGAPLPLRFGTWYWGMGHTPGHAIVEKRETGLGIGFIEETEALKPYESWLNHFSGFNMPLDGRQNYTHFTGWVVNRTGSAPTRQGEIPAPTLDLLVGDVIGKNTRFRTLDVSAAGIARENYSARGTNSRPAAEVDPIRLYARLFGPEFVDPNLAEFKPDPRIMVRKSVLSAVMEDSKAYMQSIGTADAARLDEYFTSVRSVENQLALQLEKPAPKEACLIPEKPVQGELDNIATAREIGIVNETHKVLTKLLLMAVACDQTRIFNMVFTDNFANVRKKGESYTHHLLTHEEVIDPVLGYQPLTYFFNKSCMDGWAHYIGEMAKIKEGDGTLLDNCLVFASSETNYARVHTIDGVPVYLAGKAGGRIKTGYHVVGGGDPITRIGLTVQKIMGVQVEKWGTNSLQTSKAIGEIMV